MSTETSKIDISDIDRELAKREHIEFMQYCWMRDKKNQPLIVGRHTKEICYQLDRAIAKYRKGQTFAT